MTTTPLRAQPAIRRTRTRGARGASADPREHLGGRDPLVASFEAGPFANLELQAFPQALVLLFERATGVPFNPAHLAAFERARLFLGWEGAPISAALELQRHRLELNPDDKPERVAAGDVPAPAPPLRQVHRAPSSSARDAVGPRGGIDPRDLGDER